MPALPLHFHICVGLHGIGSHVPLPARSLPLGAIAGTNRCPGAPASHRLPRRALGHTHHAVGALPHARVRDTDGRRSPGGACGRAFGAQVGGRWSGPRALRALVPCVARVLPISVRRGGGLDLCVICLRHALRPTPSSAMIRPDVSATSPFGLRAPFSRPSCSTLH